VQSAPHARHADVTITIAYTIDARRMLDEADERWIAEHGFATDNPLLGQIEHAGEMLRENPQLAPVIHHRGRLRGEVRRLLLHSGWHLYYRFQPDRNLIEIVAVWFANRGSEPPL
jgi:hypothetical protein